MLDAAALQNLTSEEKARLVEFERTFNTKGWEFIVEWANKSADEQLERMQYADSWDSFQAMRTAMFAFRSFAGLEEETYAEFERIGAARAEDKLVEIELDNE